jgi:D-alanyl-D-alanine carboxypeptidase
MAASAPLASHAPAEGPRPPIGETDLAPGTPASGHLAWVNPARCVSSCAFDPGAALRRVNDHGELDARGHHRLDVTALTALRELLADARAAGHALRIASAYRSYDEQVRVFRSMKEKGRAARPGHSEHQLGTTIDLRLPTTRAIEWLAAHAAEHGFVLSYPPRMQRITGYRPEPWHVRFVGREIAAEVPAGGTLEELFRRRPVLAESGDCADCPAAASRTTCGRITAEGVCSGTVLSWCFDGALATVDCATFDSACGSGTGSGGVPDCIPLSSAPSVPSAPGAPQGGEGPVPEEPERSPR